MPAKYMAPANGSHVSSLGSKSSMNGGPGLAHCAAHKTVKEGNSLSCETNRKWIHTCLNVVRSNFSLCPVRNMQMYSEQRF